MRTRPLVRVLLAALAIATLGACASIPERAWSNGQAMSNSRAYQRAMGGDMSLGTQSRLKAAADPRRMNHREIPYAPFSYWW